MNFKQEYNKLRGEVYQLNKHIEELEDSSFIETLIDRYASNSSIPSSIDDNHKIIPNSRVRTGLKPDDYIVNDSNYVKTNKKITKQVIDISLNIKVTEYVAYIYKNKVTKGTYHPSFPNNINNEVNYGSSVKALAYMLNNYCNVSIDKVVEIIKQLSKGWL